MSRTMKAERIEWIDIAKAITIIIMIAGHTVSFGTGIRNLVFSFHMPLFYILTGYTIREHRSWTEICNATKKDFKRIYMPVIYTEIILVVLKVFLDKEGIAVTIKDVFVRTIWASAVNHNGHPALGALWFLVVLFWSKLFYHIIVKIFSEKDAGIVFLFCILLTYFVSNHIWLPQSWDLVPIVSFYIYTGKFLSTKKDWVNNNQSAVVLISFVFWISTWNNGIYIEVGVRSFPYLLVSVFEAIAGSLCIFQLSKSVSRISENMWSKQIKKCMNWIGANTLLILCIHHLDHFVLRYIHIYDPDNHLCLSVIIRIGVVLVITYLMNTLKQWINHCLKHIPRICT